MGMPKCWLTFPTVHSTALKKIGLLNALLYTLETDVMLVKWFCLRMKSRSGCDDTAEWMRMLWDEAVCLCSNPLLFFTMFFSLCVSWGLGGFFYRHLLYFIHPDVQLYCFYHHVLRGTYLKSSRYPVHAVALLCYLMTEVPSCPLFLLSIFSEAINLQSRSHEVPLPRLWHVHSTRYCRLREVRHVLKTHIDIYQRFIYRVWYSTVK